MIKNRDSLNNKIGKNEISDFKTESGDKIIDLLIINFLRHIGFQLLMFYKI